MSVNDFQEMGYKNVKRLKNGQLAGVMSMIFTAGLFVGLDPVGYEKRFCYETEQEAVDALDLWDGTGDPPGLWIKEKPSGRYGPGLASDDARIQK